MKEDLRDTIPIVASYKDYVPPFDIPAQLRKALRVVPAKYLVGLDRIVLTNTAELPRARRRAKTYSRKRTVRIPDTLGLYHPATKNGRAYIELFVDKRFGSGALLERLQREAMKMSFASTLFHEIGHHIHFTKYPEQGEPERIANKYRALYMKRYWWRVLPVFLLLAIPVVCTPAFWRALPTFIKQMQRR